MAWPQLTPNATRWALRSPTILLFLYREWGSNVAIVGYST